MATGVAVAAGGTLLGACSSSSKSTTPTTTKSAHSAMVRFAIQAAEGTLTPYTYVTGYPGYNLLTMVYDTLLVLDKNNKPTPLLATGVTVSADGLTYTLPLRQGVTWHDGMPFTGDDVLFTYNYVKQYTFSRWTAEVQAVQSITQSGNTITITLSHPQADFLVTTLSDMPMLPKHIWSAITTPKQATDATGTGPYKLASYVEGQRYTLQANPSYFLGAPTVDTVVVPIIPDSSTIFASIEAGQLDGTAAALDPSLVSQFQHTSGLAVARGPGYISTMLQFNDGQGALANATVRQAIALALDPKQLIQTALLGFGVVGNLGYAAPGSPIDVGFVQYTTDPAKANSMLDGAGFAKGANGTRVANGAPMSYTLLAKSTAPTDIRTAQLIAQMLTPIGITVTVDPLDATALDDKVWPGFDVTMGRSYDMTIWSWSAPIMLAGTQLGKLLGSSASVGPDNVGGFRDSAVDALIPMVDNAVDASQHKSLLMELEMQIATKVPFATLYYADLLYGYRPAAYNSWVFQAGQGILQKLSFIHLGS